MNFFHTPSPGVVAITGASAGVGRTIAHQFARAGWRIRLIARDTEALEEVKQEVEQFGGSAAADVPTRRLCSPRRTSSRRLSGTSTSGSTTRWSRFFAVWEMTPEEFRCWRQERRAGPSSRRGDWPLQKS